MSLFRLVEWVSHLIPNASAVLNASFFQERDQLVVGGEDGQIVILDPGYRDDSNHVILTSQTKHPVLQMAFGNFLANMSGVLAVLSPKKLTFYEVRFAPDESHASLDEIFSHSFQTFAWNMCDIPKEEHTTKLLVQSIDCKISLFEGDQMGFLNIPLRSLHPGPVGFCQTNEMLYVANNGFLAAVKFSLMDKGGQKKINYDWNFNLGDTALQMEVTEGEKPTTIVLCRRHVSAFLASGTVTWQIRLEAVGMAMCLYRSLLINNTQFNRLIIATSDDTLLIFQDNKLVWNCNAQMSPVALLVCSYNKSYENTITLMSAHGKIVVGYLGTEPSLYKVPVDKFIVNYAERMEQFKALEASIREADAVGSSFKKTDGIQMRLSIGEFGKRTIEPNAAANAPYSMVLVEFSELHDVTKLQLNISSELACPSKQMIIQVPSSASTHSVQIPFYVGAKSLPTSNRVTLAAHDYFTQMTAMSSIDLPLKVMFDDTQVDRNAKFKLTIDSSAPVVPLNKLFAEYESENPQAIGLSLHGTDKTISVFAANKSNRYRIQSEHIFLVQVIAKELVRRIAESSPEGVKIDGNIPFEYIEEILATIQQLEQSKKEHSKTMDCRTKEVRAIEALSLNSCKTGNMTNLPSIDALFEKSYRELLDTMDLYNQLSVKIASEKSALNSLFQLCSDLGKLQNVDTTITGGFWTDTQQSLRDRLRWAVRTERGNEMNMIERLTDHAPRALPIEQLNLSDAK